MAIKPNKLLVGVVKLKTRKKKLWIAIDPGEVIGWVVFEDSSVVDCKSGSFYEFKEYITNMNFVEAVIESSYYVPHSLGKWSEVWILIGRITQILESRGTVVVYQNPSYKRCIKQIPDQYRQLKLNRHQKDALKIGLWHLQFYKKVCQKQN